MKPEFRTHNSYRGDGETNYCYMNTKKIKNSDFKYGLGFGGNNDMKKFRIWIDGYDMFKNSYVNDKDMTFWIAMDANCHFCGGIQPLYSKSSFEYTI